MKLGTAIVVSPRPAICHDAPGRTYGFGNELRFNTNRTIILAPFEHIYCMNELVLETIFDRAHLDGKDLAAKLKNVDKVVVTLESPYLGIIDKLAPALRNDQVYWVLSSRNSAAWGRIIRLGHNARNILEVEPELISTKIGEMAHNWTQHGRLIMPVAQAQEPMLPSRR
jgi:hypothetical protein